MALNETLIINSNINAMKRILYLTTMVVALLFGSCAQEFDDSEIWDKLDNHENRIAKLEELCRQMNTNISSLQTIVSALQNNDYVTGVTPITENGKTIGYTITFTKSQPVTIYHGEDGKDGQNGTDGADGKDGSTPVIGVKMDDDGIYYWTLNGEWLTDDNGNKIKAVGTDGKYGQDGADGKDGANGADGEDGKDGQNGTNGADGKDGITPQLKIEDGYWFISYDNGTTWTQLGKATGENGDSMFKDVVYDGAYVYFIFSDNTSIKVPKVNDVALLSMKFTSKHNPVVLIQDFVCDIFDNGVVNGRIPHIVDSKQLIPTFEISGKKVVVGDTEIISGESIIDCSKPVTITVVGNNGTTKDYTIEIMAFTGLPIMYINTENNTEITSKDDYLNATIRIVEDINTRAAGDVWTSEVKIKGRGNTTWGMPKKPYKLKFAEKVSLLGEPKDKEWVLLANYSDKTAIRNELAFFMGRMSNLDYTCRTHYVDLVLNNKYVGTYQLGEQQKIADNRVNVGDDGYLLEIDSKASSEDITFSLSTLASPVNIKDPDVEKGSEEYNYIVNYFKDVEVALFSDDFTDPEIGYAKYMDIASFVDWYLINEIAKNNDAIFLTSCYMHHKPGDKLYMGPLWDFDIAFGNVYYNNNNDYTGFWIRKATWYARLFQDPAFVKQVKERFAYFYNNKDVIFNEINENAEYLKYSVMENNAVWKTLYQYTWPNYAIWGSYDNEVAYLKQWLNSRLEWLKSEFDAM